MSRDHNPGCDTHTTYLVLYKLHGCRKLLSNSKLSPQLVTQLSLEMLSMVSCAYCMIFSPGPSSLLPAGEGGTIQSGYNLIGVGGITDT